MPAVPYAVCRRLPRRDGFLTARAQVYGGQLAASSALLATTLKAAQAMQGPVRLGWHYVLLLHAAALDCMFARDIAQPPLIFTSLLTRLA
jgi:hypothetical protein